MAYIDITLLWGSLNHPERRATQSMALSLGTVGYRTKATIEAFFTDNLPQPHAGQRIGTWRRNWKMNVTTIEIGGENVQVYLADEQWCGDLFICFDQDDCLIPPTPSPRLAGYGSPITSGFWV